MDDTMLVLVTARAALFAHVAIGAGTLALAPAALLMPKGGTWHRRVGRVYGRLMLAVCATAAVISFARGSYAMLTVTLLAFYLTFSGQEALGARARRRGVVWGTLALLVVVCVYAAVRWAGGDVEAGANLPLGLWASVYCVIDLRRGRRESEPMAARRSVHGTRMILSYVATVTAFAITNLRTLPPAVTTFGPLALGLACIGYFRVKGAQRPVAVTQAGDAFPAVLRRDR